MARPLRVEFPGAVYHVTSRGACDEAIFLTDEDRKTFLKTLASVADRYRVLCHAYCLLDDQYHLLLETPEANLSRSMRQLNGVYGHDFSRRHRRPGQVLGGRYKAQVVEKDSDLLEFARYVVLAPVRAGLVADPAKWRWSSYAATAGEAPVPPFLETDWLLALLGGKTPSAAHANYKSFVARGLREDKDALAGLEGRPIVGGEAFAESLEPCLHDLAQSRKVAKKRRAPPLSGLLGRSSPPEVRNARICEAYRRHGYTMKAIADYLHLHYSTVSRIVSAAEE
jgi:putative transposase